ncbi:MAG: hypothetical protein EA377_05820 [Phycisphaerales bacterium]|nr:MAG: hypothetical protein EA377_05820 [Phycisphaerales bacterium]
MLRRQQIPFQLNRHCKPLMIAVAAGTMLLAGDALGQRLSDRINQVMQDRQREEARNTDKGYMLSVLLYTDLTIRFQDTEARDALNHLRDVLGIPIVGRWMDDRTGMGLNPRARINLNAENRPALAILESVLEQAADFEDTTWQLRDGFVEVGTKERLSVPAARETRFYDIRDLLWEPTSFDNAPNFDLDQALQQGGGGGAGGGGAGGGGGGFGGGGGGGVLFGGPGEDPEFRTTEERAQDLIELIRELIEPDAWFNEWASIRYYQGALIIRAPDYIHRQINGYPYRTRPVRGSASATDGQRFLTFAGSQSIITVNGWPHEKSHGTLYTPEGIVVEGGSADAAATEGGDEK